MVFSTNQNRQFYVLGTYKEGAALTNLGDFNDAAAAFTESGNPCPYFYITQKGYGGVVKTDIINPADIMSVSVSTSKDYEFKLKAVKVSLSDAVNSGNPISGQDYILRVNFRQLYGMSDEDIYQKYGAVHATAAMESDTESFYTQMIYSLKKNFSRVYSPLLDLGVKVSSTIKVVASATKASDGTITLKDTTGTDIDTTSIDGFYILEASQEAQWRRGIAQYTPVYFEVIPTTVTDASGSEVVWGTVADATAAYGASVSGLYKLADLEYFCMGERGDQYRGMNWPNNIETKYMITDAAIAANNEVAVIDIHYAYQGTCEDIQKSEKTLTLVAGKTSAQAVLYDLGQLAQVDPSLQAKMHETANALTFLD